MPFTNGQVIDEDDYIDFDEKNATPANDTGKAVKLEADAKFHRYFVHQNQKSALLAGENITGATTPQACFIMSEQRINRFKLLHTSFNNTENDFEVYNNGAGTDNRLGHRFNSGVNDYIKGIAIEGSSEGNISGHNYIAELFAVDGSGFPTGAAIGSQAFTDAQFVSTGSADTSYWYIEFSTQIAISQSTNYIMTFRETTTTGSSTVNMHIYVNSDPLDANDSRYTTNGSSWANGYPSQGDGGMANVIIYGNITQTVGRVYLSDGDDADKNYFDGFVNETDTAGNSVDLSFGNEVPGFTSLLAGTDYYLSTTPGAITATRGKGKKVGTAKTTTSISPNYRPEISDMFRNTYDFNSGVVPFVADAFVWGNGSQQDQIHVIVSPKFHEAMFGKDDKKYSVSNPLTSEYKDMFIVAKQGDYARVYENVGSFSSDVIRYQL